MVSLLEILLLLVRLVQYVIIAHIIMSWLINFQVLNLRQPLVWNIWNGLERLLNPIYSRIRSVLPNLGGLDLAPLILLLATYALQIVISNNLHVFY